jgi:hypothetical protein
VTLSPGIYFLQGGGFSVSGSVKVTGIGVIIINAPKSSADTINVSGSASLTLSPPTNLTGAYARYNGITIFQDPNSAAPITQGGSVVLTMSGILYAPKATLSITGAGGMVVNNDETHGIGAEVIVSDLSLTNLGGLTINVPDPPATLASAVPSSFVVSWAVAPSPSTADVYAAALGAITDANGFGIPMVADASVLDDVAKSVVSDGWSGPTGKKPQCPLKQAGTLRSTAGVG